VAHIFISHATADRAQAEAILAACEGQGLTCWIAPRDIVAGTSWADAILRGIADASIVLLVHSLAANESPMVLREIDAAAAARRPILPVRIDAAMPREGMQFYLSATHWFDAPPPLAAHLPSLVETIARLLQPSCVDNKPGRTILFPEFGQPAIAVLPFRFRTDDDAPFADGLTEELINALSRWRSFPVIARNSVFAWRGRDQDMRLVGRELGARYIVSGSVRRHDGQARVNLDLVDAETGETLLSERHENAAADPQAIQDELVLAIAGLLAPELLKLERTRAVERPSPVPGVYDLYERGMWHRYRNKREELETAEALFRQALELDPHYGRASTALSLCRNFAAISKWVPDVPAAHAESLALARQAVADDPRDPHAHFALGVACINNARRNEAIACLREATRLNPSHAYAHANRGQILNFLNRPEEALPAIELALRLNPHDPHRFMWLPYVAASHYLAKRYRECLDACEQALVANPGYPHAMRYLIAALGQLGRREEAGRMLPLLQRIDGNLAGSTKLCESLFVPEAARHIVDGWRLAGFT
jgi:TolB-like protein/Tfp pilus assembly protein PilF